MKITAKSAIRPVLRQLDKLERSQVPFATAYALTQTAKAAQAEVEKEIARVFDRPKDYTLKAVRIRPATKQRLTAEVMLKDETVKGNPAVRYLLWEVKGGARSQKGFEKLLQRAGVMPWGWYAVPTKVAPLDSYGNVPGSVITKILSQLQASNPDTVLRDETPQQKKLRNSVRNRSKKRLSRYFAVLPGRVKTQRFAPGIWERVSFGFGSSVRPVFIYVSRPPTYKMRLHFDAIVRKTVHEQLPTQFARAIALAQSTAK